MTNDLTLLQPLIRLPHCTCNPEPAGPHQKDKTTEEWSLRVSTEPPTSPIWAQLTFNLLCCIILRRCFPDLSHVIASTLTRLCNLENHPCWSRQDELSGFNRERGTFDMAVYECNVCGFIYDEELEGIPWDELGDDWECSGEGGILDESLASSCKYVSVRARPLQRNGPVKAACGRHRDQERAERETRRGRPPSSRKVTAEIAAIRGFPQGVDIISPCHFPDIKDKHDLRKRVDWLRAQVREEQPFCSDSVRPLPGQGVPGSKPCGGHVPADHGRSAGSRPDFAEVLALGATALPLAQRP